MKQIITTALALSNVMGFAQDYNGRVGINTSEPKATLHIKETTPTTEADKKRPQGVALPMLTTADRALFENTQAGTMIYNTDKKCIDFYNGTAWVCLDGTLKEPPIAQVWDRTHYIASFNHNGANIDGQISNELKLKIAYNGAIIYRNYEPINIQKTVQDRDGNDVKLTLNIEGGQFTSLEGFLEATIKVENGGVYKVKHLSANTEELITSFNFSIGGREATVKLIASGGVLDKNFGQTNYNLIYVPVSVYTLNSVPASGEPYEKKWLNNNLGANYANRDKTAVFNPVQQATSHNDHNAYGSLFQWQRPADGHELVNWTSSTTGDLTPTTTILWDNTNWKPNHSKFITNPNSEYSWVNNTINSSTSNKDLWQSGKPNNPCPQGYHPPTNEEWIALNSSMGSNNYTYWATQNLLRLPAAGSRSNNNGSPNNQGSYGRYWSSSPGAGSNGSHYLTFGSSGSTTYYNNRAYGFSVRCLSD